jgi:hypothetical protein
LLGVEESNHRHHRLLRARRERPRSRSAAEQRDEVAPFQFVELHLVPHERGTVSHYVELARLRQVERERLQQPANKS